MSARPVLAALVAMLVAVASCVSPSDGPAPAEHPDGPYVVVLGIAQDGGVPQAGTVHPGWTDPALRHAVASIALVDPESGGRWLFDATPDLPEQLAALDAEVPPNGRAPGLDGIFLTHAHIGHYTGLMYLGHESMGAREVPVLATERLGAFLEQNGPWSQLVAYGNIRLARLSDGTPVELADGIRVTPIAVPHRQEYADVVGFRIDGPQRSLLYIPDIDSWEEWDTSGVRVEELIASVDVALVDGTFFADGEIPGRDMSGFPHPFITHSMNRFASLPPDVRSRVRFIHMNHTNPVLRPDSEARKQVVESGFHVASTGERHPL